MDKLRIFISWSGQRSGAVAGMLKKYLPLINPNFDLWLSSIDIDKGSRSTTEISEALNSARAGIICLTPNNLNEPWILFEAGGIAKVFADQPLTGKPLACTLLIGLEPSDLSKPLYDFQATRLEKKEELLKLIKTLNKALGDAARENAQIDKIFEYCWPEIEAELPKLPDDGPTHRPKRKPEEMLAEILDSVRKTEQDTAQLKRAEQGNTGGIYEILTKLNDLTAPVTSPYLASGLVSGPFGSGRKIRLSDLVGNLPDAGTIRPNTYTPPLTFLGGADTSTSGNEPPCQVNHLDHLEKGRIWGRVRKLCSMAIDISTGSIGVDVVSGSQGFHATTSSDAGVFEGGFDGSYNLGPAAGVYSEMYGNSTSR